MAEFERSNVTKPALPAAGAFLLAGYVMATGCGAAEVISTEIDNCPRAQSGALGICKARVSSYTLEPQKSRRILNGSNAEHPRKYPAPPS
jgi:hypothetical protein